MIEKIENFTKKSFEEYTGPDNGNFLKNNIIFGYNGKGKSSLAEGILESYIKSGGSMEDTRFYNRGYIENVLLLQDSNGSEKIRGVVANFGEKEVDIEQQINNLMQEKVNTDDLENKIKLAKEELRRDIDVVHERRKGSASIQKKASKTDVLEVCRLYEDDLGEALKIEPNEKELQSVIGDNAIENKITQLEAISIVEIEDISEDVVSVKAIFERSFDDTYVPSAAVVEWINTGLAIHEGNYEDACQFCGGPLHLQEIKQLALKYNNDDKQQSITDLNNIKKKIESISSVIKDNCTQQALIESLLVGVNDSVGNKFEEILSHKDAVTSFIKILEAKVSNITDKSVEYDDITDSLQAIKSATEEIRRVIKGEIDRLRRLSSKKEILIKGSIGLEIRNNSGMQAKIQKIKDLADSLVNGQKTNKDIDDKIRKLQSSKSPTADFADYINGVLKNIGIRFEVIVDAQGQNYIIRAMDSENSLSVSDISEGEKNILALIFFYYELFSDNEQASFKENIQLIIVDDPISSLDEINHMYIINLIEQILALPIPQVFIFTHSWEDFSTINYKFKEDKENPENRFYEITKDQNGKSRISKIKTTANPYHHHFQEVYNFSQRANSSNLSDCDIYHIPNVMRQVLEGFLGFKLMNSAPTKANEKNIGKALFNDDWQNLKEEDKTRLGELLLVINIGSHRPARNPEEVLRSSKFLMERIEEADKQHFDAHKQPR